MRGCASSCGRSNAGTSSRRRDKAPRGGGASADSESVGVGQVLVVLAACAVAGVGALAGARFAAVVRVAVAAECASAVFAVIHGSSSFGSAGSFEPEAV